MFRPGIRIGIDLASVERVGALADRYGDAVLGHVFTPGELAAARARPRRRRLVLTVCFAAKEAAGKALGIGLAGIEWTDVESVVEPARLTVTLRGAAAVRARSLGAAGLAASWTAFERRLVLVQVVVY